MPRTSRSCLRAFFRNIWSPILRLVITLVLLAVVAVIGLRVSTNPPAQYTSSSVTVDYSNPIIPQNHYRPWDPDFQFSVLIDVHRHPNNIDPDTLLHWIIAAGFNAVVLTEHNTISNSLEVQKIAREKYNNYVKVIIGEEWTNCRLHMGLLGISQDIPTSKSPTDEEIQNVINTVHAQGGVVVVNHPPWSTWAGLDQPSLDDLIAWGVDYIDVTTAERLDLQSIYYAKSKNVSIVAGTDQHDLGSVHAWTLLNIDPNNITEDSVMDALRSKNTSFIFDETGYQPPVSSYTTTNGMYILAFPWIIIGNLFHSFYDKITGQYSFVNGYCGFGEEIVVHKKEMFTSIFWLVLIWLVLEGGWGLLKLAYKRIMTKLHPDKQRLLDDYGQPLDVWDR